MKRFLKFVGGVVITYLIMSGIAMSVVIVVMKLLLDYQFTPDWLMYLVGNFTPLELHSRIIVIEMGLGVLLGIALTIRDGRRKKDATHVDNG